MSWREQLFTYAVVFLAVGLLIFVTIGSWNAPLPTPVEDLPAPKPSHSMLPLMMMPRYAKYPESLSASLDHRVPLAKGGKHSMANCQLAHLDCNVLKGAR